MRHITTGQSAAWRIAALAFAAGLALLWLDQGVARADNGRTYYFVVDTIKLSDGVPDKVEAQLRKQVAKAIDKHERLLSALPEDAPDPDADAKAFIAYTEKRKLHPYKVRVEVNDYELEVEPMPEPRTGHRITGSISLRILGVTMARSTFGFTGDGAATVKAEVGKKVRKRDRRFTSEDAAELAIGKALAMSVTRLDEKYKRGKKKRKSRKKKRQRKRKR